MKLALSHKITGITSIVVIFLVSMIMSFQYSEVFADIISNNTSTTNSTTTSLPVNGTSPQTNGTITNPPAKVTITNSTTTNPPANSPTTNPPANSTTTNPPANSTTTNPPANGTTIMPPVTDCTINSATSYGTIFKDDYSSTKGWAFIGSLITINDFPTPATTGSKSQGVVKFNAVPGGAGINEQRVIKKLPTTLPVDGWIAEFEYKFSSSSIPSSFPFVLTTNSTKLESQSESDRVLVLHGGGGIDQLRLGGSGAATPAGIPIVPNTQYFVRVQRMPTELVLSVFSDSARTIQVTGSPFVQNIKTTDFTNLNYIQHAGSFLSGSGRLITSEIDNTRIFTNTHQSQDPSCPVNPSNNTPTTNSTTTSPPANNTNYSIGERKSYDGIGIHDQIRVNNLTLSQPVDCTTNTASNDTIFKDDYSSKAGWTETGKAYVNNINFPGVAKLDHINGLGSYTNDNHRVIKHLPTVLPSQWSLKTEYTLQEDNIGTSIVVALSPSTDVIDPFDNYKSIGIYEDHQSTSLLLGEKKIPISLNVKYYLLLEKTPDQAKLSVFSDPQRIVQIPNSPIMLDISNYAYNNLTYIQHGILAQAGPARITTSEIDNTEIFTNTHQSQDPSCPVNPGNNTTTTNSTITNPPVNGTTTSPPINDIPISGLVGEWKFEDNAIDTSGNDNDGTLSGATFVDGVVGRAVSFDGIDDIVDVANDPTLNFGTGSLSVSAWIKTPGDDAWLVTHNRNNDGDYRGWSIFTGDSGIVGGVVRDGSANSVDTISTTTVFDNQFHHIVYVVDRSSQTSKLYVDCTLEDTSDVSSVGNIEQNTMGVDIGGTNSPNTAVDFHTGIMDQIRVYNRTLSQSEVNTLFHESGTECPPTLSDVLPVNGTTNLPVTNSTTTNPPPISTPEPSSTYVILVASKSSVPGCQQNNECYVPSEIRVKIGDKIKWFNSDSVAHTITSGDPSNGPDGEFGRSLWMTADTYSHEFTVEGQFNYYCTIHPWMTGTVLVGDVDYEPRSPWDGVSGLNNTSVTDPEPIATPEPVPEYDYSQPPITVFADRTSYSEGNPIKINGEVRDSLRGFPVTLQVISANNTLVTLQEVEVDKYKKYSTTLTDTQGPLWQSSGTYTVKVLYGTEFRTAETLFQFTSYYVPSEPKHETQATMSIDIVNDKVLVYGKVNRNATILENGPSIQYIESEGTSGIVSSLSDTFEWNGTDYKTFFLISNFTKVPDDIMFKLWSGNGIRGKVLAYNSATIIPSNTESILNFTEPIAVNSTVPISNYTEPVITENYTSTNIASSSSCTYCYIKPVTTNSTTSVNSIITNSTEDDINQEIVLPAAIDTKIVSKDDTKPVDASNSEITIPSQIISSSHEQEIEKFQLLKQNNQTEQNIVLWSNKSIYEDGEKIRIDGIIPQTVKRSNISIQVYSPSNFNIVNERLHVSDIGMFKIEFDTSDYLWFENGEYVIKLVDGDGKKSQLTVKVIEPIVDITPPQSDLAPIQVNSTNDDNKSIESIGKNNTSYQENSVSNESIVYLNQVLGIIQNFVGSIFS